MNAYETALALTVMVKAGEDGTVDSFAPLDGSEQSNLPTTGYYVGGVRPSLVYTGEEYVDRSDLAWFIGTTESRYFGVWKDSEDGMIYFDAVTWVESEDDALSLGRERDEIAVWDIAGNRELRCNAQH